MAHPGAGAAQPWEAGSRPTPRRLRHPIATWLVVVLSVLYAGLGLPRLFGHSVSVRALPHVLSILAFGLLFGGAVAATALSEGRDGVRRLLSGLLRWRIGTGRWLLVLAALPALTLAAAAATGTLRSPAGGWFELGSSYVLGVVTGVLLTSLWEETAWSGFVQTRLMRRHGLLAAACLTAIPFAIAHVPGAFQNATAGEALVNLAAITLLAPMLRYLSGVLLLDTGGSVLAVALLHASFNASGRLPVAVGGWQFLLALLLLTGLVACYRLVRRRRPSRPSAALPPEVAHGTSEPGNRMGGA